MVIDCNRLSGQAGYTTRARSQTEPNIQQNPNHLPGLPCPARRHEVTVPRRLAMRSSRAGLCTRGRGFIQTALLHVKELRAAHPHTLQHGTVGNTPSTHIPTPTAMSSCCCRRHQSPRENLTPLKPSLRVAKVVCQSLVSSNHKHIDAIPPTSSECWPRATLEATGRVLAPTSGAPASWATRWHLSSGSLEFSRGLGCGRY